MNWAHAHLLLNHIPVLGILFGILLFLFATLRRSRDLREAALWTFVFTALLALPTYFTGEPAEDVVMGHPGVSQAMIERHQDAALVSLVALEALGALSAAGLFAARGREHPPRWIVVGVFALALVAGLLMTRTANLGGQIHHDEIRPAGAGAAAGGEDKD